MKKKIEKKPDPFETMKAIFLDLVQKLDAEEHENKMLKMVIRSQQLRIEIQKVEMQIISIKHWMDIHAAKTA